MRDIPSELAARIETGAATLCHAWTVERRDGQGFGFTDHDQPLVVDDVACVPGSGWIAGATETAEGLAPGTLALAGGIDSEAIREDDIDAGLWDGARVTLWRVDWPRPDLRVALATGRLSRIRREGEGFSAEVEGPMAALERVVGRTYGAMCDAVLGDARCGVPAEGRVCDKRWRTCVETFGNGVNFRGFPDIPGDDFLTAYPASGERHDGRSRR